MTDKNLSLSNLLLQGNIYGELKDKKINVLDYNDTYVSQYNDVITKFKNNIYYADINWRYDIITTLVCYNPFKQATLRIMYGKDNVLEKYVLNRGMNILELNFGMGLPMICLTYTPIRIELDKKINITARGILLPNKARSDYVRKTQVYINEEHSIYTIDSLKLKLFSKSKLSQ